MARKRYDIRLTHQAGDAAQPDLGRFVRATCVLWRIARRLEAEGIDWARSSDPQAGPPDGGS